MRVLHYFWTSSISCGSPGPGGRGGLATATAKSRLVPPRLKEESRSPFCFFYLKLRLVPPRLKEESRSPFGAMRTDMRRACAAAPLDRCRPRRPLWVPARLYPPQYTSRRRCRYRAVGDADIELRAFPVDPGEARQDRGPERPTRHIIFNRLVMITHTG